MLLASTDYPFLNAMLTMLVFFAWVLWIWLLIMVYMDIFRRDDIGGWGKTGWVVFTLLVPYIGVFTYLISQGRGMGERRMAYAARRQSDFDDYVRTVSASGQHDGAQEIAKARELLDTGVITQEEFETMKQRALVS